jgi:hypothetical protein
VCGLLLGMPFLPKEIQDVPLPHDGSEQVSTTTHYSMVTPILSFSIDSEQCTVTGR